MKNILIILITVISFTNFAHANVIDENTTSEMKFNLLLRHFDAGSLPSANDVLGLKTGRCYHSDAPNTAYGELLAAKYVFLGSAVSTPDDGPLFPNEPSPNSTPVLVITRLAHGAYEAPDRYDILSPSDKIDLDRALSDPNFSKRTAFISENSLVYRDEIWQRKTLVRKHGSYLFTKTVQTDDQIGKITNVCYFFKEVEFGHAIK